MTKLRKLIEKINTAVPFCGLLRYDEPMAAHCTFKVGGPADVWIRPDASVFKEYCSLLLPYAAEAAIPLFVLGAGANIVPSDKGIRGIVLDTGAWSGLEFGKDFVDIYSGTDVDKAAMLCAEKNRSCIEFLAGMPGSIGGAAWMNARCYGKSMSDVFVQAELLDEHGMLQCHRYPQSAFDYKSSPFQKMKDLILSVRLKTRKANSDVLYAVMEELRLDRETKGHYRLPCAGSAFKNNYAYGKPSGIIIDELGLRGYSRGGAKVADWHGNIIVNTGSATASDIKSLSEYVRQKVLSERGLDLESEILFVGDWT